MVKRGEASKIDRETINKFHMALPQEHRFALLIDMVEEWGKLGAGEALLATLKEVTGL
jgi:hypothetical protein